LILLIIYILVVSLCGAASNFLFPSCCSVSQYCPYVTAKCPDPDRLFDIWRAKSALAVLL
jgi:hypothetical protein